MLTCHDVPLIGNLAIQFDNNPLVDTYNHNIKRYQHQGIVFILLVEGNSTIYKWKDSTN